MTDPLRAIDDYLDGLLDASECAALAAWIKASPANAAIFADKSALHARLGEVIGNARVKATPIASVASGRRSEVGGQRSEIRDRQSAIGNRKLAIYSAVAVAAALLAACGVAIYVIAISADPSDIEHRPSPIAHPPLATLIESTPGSNLTTPGGFISEGRDYPRGAYSLDKGTAEFMLTNSVNVKLRGETHLVMRSDMNVALTRGSARFVVPAEAKGFTVHLPDGSRIVDLGTAFRVTLDADGNTRVRVTEGLVEVVDAGGAGVRLDPTMVGTIADGRFTKSPLRSHQAYGAQTGTVGLQGNFDGSLGLDFAVDRDITVTHLGAFDSASDGLKRPINVRLYERADGGTVAYLGDDSAGELIAEVTIQPGTGKLEQGHRVVELDEPIELPAGFRGTIVASGYGIDEPNGNRLQVSTSPLTDPDRWVTEAADGAIRFLPTVRFGPAPGWPTTIDSGSQAAVVYAAGTFRYTTDTTDAIEPEPKAPHTEPLEENRR